MIQHAKDGMTSQYSFFNDHGKEIIIKENFTKKLSTPNFLPLNFLKH